VNGTDVVVSRRRRCRFCVLCGCCCGGGGTDVVMLQNPINVVNGLHFLAVPSR
jgi:hypothetical protein